MLGHVKSRMGDLDPRIGLVWIAAYIVAGLVFYDYISLSVILATIILTAAAAGILGNMIIKLKGLWLIIIVIGLIFGLTVPGEAVFYLIPPGVPIIGGSLPVSAEGLYLGFISVLRMFIFVLPLLIYLAVVETSKMTNALLYFKVPYQYALMLTLALNFIPLYIEEFERIIDAQRARAHTMVDKGWIGKARAFIPLLVPLTLNAIERADTVGKVLELRGYGGEAKVAAVFDKVNKKSIVIAVVSAIIIGISLASAILGRSLILDIIDLIT